MRIFKTGLLIILLNLFTSVSVFADVGVPVIPTQGGVITTDGEHKNISMKEEKVTIEYKHSEKYKGQVLEGTVTATFTMENHSSKEQVLQVYFPLNESVFLFGYNDPSMLKALTNFAIDGKILGENSLTEVVTLIEDRELTIPAYVWEETFPPDAEKEIKITYNTEAAQGYELYHLTYILTTGASWKGSIEKGIVEFILPEDLQAYSVVRDVPLIEETSTLPYTVENNKITIEFENYEPKGSDVIVLGVYDFELVNKVENLKKKEKTFWNTLVLADTLKTISVGPHCYFCTGETAQMALDAYENAIDLAKSKENLLYILESFIFWHNKGIEEIQTISESSIYEYNLQENFGIGECDDTKDEYEMQGCAKNLAEKTFYLHPFFRSTISTQGNKVQNKDFLLAVAHKMENYDKTLAENILGYITLMGDTIEVEKDETPQEPEESENPQKEPRTTKETKTQQLKPLLVGILLGSLFVTGSGLSYLLIKRKKNKKQEKPLEEPEIHKNT